MIRSLVLAWILTAISAVPAAVDPEVSTPADSAFPLHDEVHYTVSYLGVTCGHLYLSGSLESFEGRPAFHLVARAHNSKFFNHIHRVDALIESWVDAETLSTIVYQSTVVEKDKTATERHVVDRGEGVVRSVEDGVETTLSLEGEGSVLDPLAYLFRLQVLARNPGDEIELTLMTDKGAVRTRAVVRGPIRKRTALGRRDLLEIEPHSLDAKMFTKKGGFSLWVDPEDSGLLYFLDFRLSFGHLLAKIAKKQDGRPAPTPPPEEPGPDPRPGE